MVVDYMNRAQGPRVDFVPKNLFYHVAKRDLVEVIISFEEERKSPSSSLSFPVPNDCFMTDTYVHNFLERCLKKA